MPSALTVVVHSARGITSGDGSNTIPNTCVEWSFGTKSKRTKAARGSQPVFEETFKAEVADDASLSTEPLYIRLLDRDVPREETLGSLVLSLDIMLRADSTSFNSHIAGGRRSMSGWFPLWDSLESTPRAWLHVTVEVRMFSQPGAAGTAGTSSSTLPVNSSGSASTGLPPPGPRSRAETGSSRAINSKNRRDMAQASTSLAASGLSASAEGQDGAGPSEPGGTGTGAGAIPIFFADAFEHRLYPYAAYCGFVEELIVCPDPAYSTVGAAGPLSSGLAANSHQLSGGGTGLGSASLQTPGLAHSLSTGLGGAPSAVGSAVSNARRVNEARSLLLYRMSSQLRASVAKKAALLGANAILGFSVSFDVEGDSGLAGRARGTAVCTYRPRLEDATAAWAYALELLNPERARARSIETTGNEGDAADTDADGVLRSTSSRLGYISAMDGTGRSSVQSIEGSAGAAALAAALGIQRQASGFRVTDGLSGGLGYSTPLSDATPAAPTQATKALPLLQRQGSGDSGRRGGSVSVGTGGTGGAKREGSTKDVLAPGASKGGLGSKGLSLSASATQLQVERQKEAAARASKEHRRLIRELTKSLKDEKRYCREERRLLRRSWALQEVALRQTLHALYWRTMDAPQHRYNRWGSTGMGGAYGSEYGRSSNVDLLTLKMILPGTRLHLGGLVAVRSVRYLGRLKAGALSDQETRDTWWAEVRAEVRDHARKLGCTQIIGYSESTAICNDAIVLSAVGTAARLKQGQTMSDLRYILTSAASRKDRKETAGALQERTSKRSRSRAALRTAELETQAHMSGGDGSGPAPSAAALSNARRAWHPDPTRRAWYLQTQAHVLTAAQAEATHAAAVAAKYDVQAPSAGTHPPGLLHVNSSSSRGVFSSSPGRVNLSAPTTDTLPADTVPPLFATVEGGNETAAVPQPLTAAPPALHMAHLRPQNSFGSSPHVASGPGPTGSAQGATLQVPSTAEGPLSAAAPASLQHLQSEISLTVGGTFGTPKSYTPGLQTPGGTGISTALGSATGLSSATPAAITQSAMVSTAIANAKALRLSIDVDIGRAIALNAGLSEREHVATGVLPCFVSVDPTCAPGNTAQRPCSMLHLPYTKTAGVGAPFHGMSVSRCRSCARAAVPSVLLSTTDVPPTLQVTGTGMFIEATAVRRKDSSATGEAECVKLSEELLFLEYAMHQQIMLKLRAAGRNALFGVRTNVAFRGALIIGSISGTAVLLDALAPPAPLQLRRGGSDMVKLLFDGLSKLCESSRRSLLAATAHARAVERILRPLSMAVLIDTRSKYDVIVRQGKKLQVAVLQVNAKKRKALLQGALASLQYTPVADTGGLARAARTSIGPGTALATVPASPSHIGSGSGPSTPGRKLSNCVELDSALAEGGMIVLPPTVTSAASGALVAEGWSAASQYAAERGSPAQVLSPQLLHDRMRKSGSKPKSASKSHRDRDKDKERDGRDKDREGKRAKESRHSKHRGRERRTRKTSSGGHSSDSSSSSSSSSSSGRSGGGSQGSPTASAGGGAGAHSRRESAGAGSSGPSSAIGTGGIEGSNAARDRERDMERLARRYRGSFDHSMHAGGASAAARGMGELSRPSSVMSETSTASRSSFRSRSRSGDSSSPTTSSTSSSSTSSSSSSSTSTSSTDSSTDSGWSSDGSSSSSETDSLSEGLSMSSTSSSSSSSGSSTSSSSSRDSYGADRRRHHHHGHRHESDSSSSSSGSSRSSRSYSSSSGSSTSSDSSSGSSGGRQRKKRRHRHRHGHGKHRRSGADRGERSRRVGGQGEIGLMDDAGSEDEGGGPVMIVGRARTGQAGRGTGMHGNAGSSGAAGASDSLRTYVIEIEDEQGEDVASVLADVTSFNPPPGISLLSTSTCHGALSSSLGEGPLLHPFVLPPAVQDVAERNSGLVRSHDTTAGGGDVSSAVPTVSVPVTDSPDQETGTSTPKVSTGEACTDNAWDMEALARVQSRAERVSGRGGPGQGGTGLDATGVTAHSAYRGRLGQGSGRTPGSATARLQAGLASTRSLTSATMTRMAVLSAASPSHSGGDPSGYAAGSTSAPDVQWTDVPTWHVCARQAALLLPAPLMFSLRFRWDDLTLVQARATPLPAGATVPTQDLHGVQAALAGLPPDLAALWSSACDTSTFAADLLRLETSLRRPGLVSVPATLPVPVHESATSGTGKAGPGAAAPGSNNAHLATGLPQSLGLGHAGSDLHRQRSESMSDATKCARVRNVALTVLYTLVAPLSPCTVCNLVVSLTIPELDEVEVQVSCGIVREATVTVDTRADEGTLKSVAASTSVLVAAPLAAQQALTVISAQPASSTAPRGKTTYQVGVHAGHIPYMDIATLAMRAFQRSLWTSMPPVVQSQQATEPRAMEDVLALWPVPTIPVAQPRHERSADPQDYLSVWLCALPEVPGAYAQSYLGAVHLYVIRQHAPGVAGGVGAGSIPGARVPVRTGTGAPSLASGTVSSAKGGSLTASAAGGGAGGTAGVVTGQQGWSGGISSMLLCSADVPPVTPAEAIASSALQHCQVLAQAHAAALGANAILNYRVQLLESMHRGLYRLYAVSGDLVRLGPSS